MPGPEVTNEERLVQFYITYDAAKMDISDFLDVLDTFINEQDGIKKNIEDIKSDKDLNVNDLNRSIDNKNYFYTMMCSRFELKESGISIAKIEGVYDGYINKMTLSILSKIDPKNKNHSSINDRVIGISMNSDKGIAIRELALLENKFTAESNPKIEIMTLEEELGHLVQLNSLSTPQAQKDYVMENIPNIDNILSTSISDIAKEIKKEGYQTNKDKQGDVTKKIKLAIRDVLIQQSHTNAYRGYGKATEKEALKILIRDAKLGLEEEYSADPKFISDLFNLDNKLKLTLAKGDDMSRDEATIIWLNYVQDQLHLNDPEIPQATKNAIYNQDHSPGVEEGKKIDNLKEGISGKIGEAKGNLIKITEDRIKSLEPKLQIAIGALTLGAIITAMAFVPPLAMAFIPLLVIGATLAVGGAISTMTYTTKYNNLSGELSKLQPQDKSGEVIAPNTTASMVVVASSVKVGMSKEPTTTVQKGATTYSPLSVGSGTGNNKEDGPNIRPKP